MVVCPIKYLLMRLYQRCFSCFKSIASAFLLPASKHQVFRDKNVPVLNLDYGLLIEDNSLDLKTTMSIFNKVDEAVIPFILIQW